MTALSFVNVFAADSARLAAFYASVFGFREIEEWRTPIFRALAAGGVTLGFNAPEAYTMLGLEERSAGSRIVLSFEADSRDDVDRLVTAAVEKGAKLLKASFETYYGAYQAVLLDPEANPFRVNRMGGVS